MFVSPLKASLEKRLFSSLAHFLTGLFIFLALNYMSFLYISEINSLSVVSFAIIFSHSKGCLFTLLLVCFIIFAHFLKQRGSLVEIRLLTTVSHVFRGKILYKYSENVLLQKCKKNNYTTPITLSSIPKKSCRIKSFHIYLYLMCYCKYHSKNIKSNHFDPITF